MASVYKRGSSKSWQIAWTDHDGNRHIQSSKTTDKRAAERIGKDLESKAALRREGSIDVQAETVVRESKESIKRQLIDYQNALKAKGSSQGHIDETITKIESICSHAKFTTLADIDVGPVEKFIAHKQDKGVKARTQGAYIQAIKSFTKWAVSRGKLTSNPLASLKKPSVETDRKFKRRFLSVEEWGWLDPVTRKSEDRFGMTGQERAVLYALAIQTGLRSNELRSLTRSRLSLDSSPPFVLVDARSTKAGKKARQYIQAALAAELSKMTSRKVGGAPVFDMPHECSVADMLREDLDRARGKWLASIKTAPKRIEASESDFLRAEDSQGDILDFHALRHTCGTWLINAGADVKTVQVIMRHSDIKLTMDTYGHLFAGSEAAAVARMASVFGKKAKFAK